MCTWALGCSLASLCYHLTSVFGRPRLLLSRGSLLALPSVWTPVDGAARPRSPRVGREPPSRPALLGCHPVLSSRRGEPGPHRGSQETRPQVCPVTRWGGTGGDQEIRPAACPWGVSSLRETEKSASHESRGSLAAAWLPGRKGLTPIGMSQGGQRRTTTGSPGTHST